jgi:hypothetical protein
LLAFHGHLLRWSCESQPENAGRTRTQNLVGHKWGRYYARLFLNGKAIGKSLKTEHSL